MRDGGRFYLGEITEFMSGHGENSGPKEGIWLRNSVVPPLPEVLTEASKATLEGECMRYTRGKARGENGQRLGHPYG